MKHRFVTFFDKVLHGKLIEVKVLFEYDDETKETIIIGCDDKYLSDKSCQGKEDLTY